VVGNTADGDGGGLQICYGPITNCTIVANAAGNAGGGLESCYNSITNCILWGNTATNGAQLHDSDTPTYSCVQNWTAGGTGNTNDNPLFYDTSAPNPNDWDLHLLTGSPCIDTGTNSPPDGLPATDIEGNTRPMDGNNSGSFIADMGAYESYPPIEPRIGLSSSSFKFIASEGQANPNNQILTIHNAGTGTLNWTISETCGWLSVNPKTGSSIGEFDNVTLSVDVTGLIHGYYNCLLTVSDPAAQNSPKTVTVSLAVNSYLYVPDQYSPIQAAIDTSINGDTIIVEPGTYIENINFLGKNIVLTSASPTVPGTLKRTIIDGNNSGPVVTFAGSETSACRLTGFTITNGSTSGNGGGINGNSTQAAITNCMIVGNTANYGGGLYKCNGTITNCTFTDNTANLGGGIYNDSSSPTVTNCILWANSDTQIYNNGTSSPVVTYCDVQAGYPGTGNIDADPLFVNPAKGIYYLNQTNAGQTVNSPCINTGSNTANNIGMNTCTTRTDGLTDAGIVDMGYHYPAFSVSNFNIADIDHSGHVDLLDFAVLYSQWLDIPGTPSADIAPPGGDGFVDMQDLLVLADNWLILIADFDESGYVDLVDFAILYSQWLNVPSVPSADIAPPGGNGFVDMQDLFVLIDNWLDDNSPFNIADLDKSNRVDLIDFAILYSQWLDTPGIPSADIAPPGGDNFVDMQDLLVLAENWLLLK